MFVEQFRPVSNVSQAGMQTLLSSPMMVGGLGDNEMRSASRNGMCVPRNNITVDAYVNLTDTQVR